jgi:WD40 repeat protein
VKHHIYCLITAYLLIAASCHAMELTAITNPRSIAFVDNKTVVVGGKNGCGVFDSASQKLIHTLTPSDIYSLAANKDIVAVLGVNQTKDKPRSKLTVFNTETGKKKWSEAHYTTTNCAYNNFCTSDNIVLSQIDTTLFVSTGGAIITYDYIKQQKNYTEKAFSLSCRNSNRDITCHPTKNILLYSDLHMLYTIQIPPKAQEKYLYPLQQIRIHNSYARTKAISGPYSPDGSKIVFSYNKKYCLYDVINGIAYEISIHQQRYVAAAFHPNCPILALLSKDNSVLFWNYLTRKDLAKTYPKDICKKENRVPFAKRLAFCPSGTQLAVALTDNWMVINTPGFNKNFAAIFYVLHKELLKELIEIIMLYIAYPPQLSYCDPAALLEITPLPVLQPTTMEINSYPHGTEHKRVNWYYEEDKDDSLETHAQ